MRSYRRDSPEAAARIVSIALIADGHHSRGELEALDCCGARERLGISQEALHDVVRTLCEDLLASSSGDWAAACTVDAATLESILDEVQDPLLRLEVLQLCLAAIASDGHVTHGESAVVRAAIQRWGLARDWPTPQRRAA
jgi:hypothetical protein